MLPSIVEDVMSFGARTKTPVVSATIISTT